MIEIQKAKEVFEEYVKGYDQKNAKIQRKHDHTYRVAILSRKIAEKLQLPEEEIQLAELIGILHDIGRFEQLKRYGTFVDRNSIDHAELGIDILFEQGKIREFIQTDQYDTIIKKAIKNHNQYAIEEGLNKEELLQAEIIKDADKTDILYIHTGSYVEEVFSNVRLESQYVSDYIIKNMQNHRLAENAKAITKLDHYLSAICFIFDYHFKEALEIVREKNYISESMKPILNMGFSKETKDQIRYVENMANEFLAKH